MTEAPVIVDSSKDPLLLKHLYSLAPDKIKVIHLVRDARAVSLSFVSNFDRDGTAYVGEDTGKKPNFATAAKFWRERNRNIRIASWHIPQSQRLFLPYEQLCMKRDLSSEALSNFVGEQIVIPEEIHLQKQHTIAGNPMRQREASIRVSLSEAWQLKLTPSQVMEIESAAHLKV